MGLLSGVTLFLVSALALWNANVRAMAAERQRRVLLPNVLRMATRREPARLYLVCAERRLRGAQSIAKLFTNTHQASVEVTTDVATVPSGSSVVYWMSSASLRALARPDLTVVSPTSNASRDTFFGGALPRNVLRMVPGEDHALQPLVSYLASLGGDEVQVAHAPWAAGHVAKLTQAFKAQGIKHRVVTKPTQGATVYLAMGRLDAERLGVDGAVVHESNAKSPDLALEGATCVTYANHNVTFDQSVEAGRRLLRNGIRYDTDVALVLDSLHLLHHLHAKGRTVEDVHGRYGLTGLFGVTGDVQFDAQGDRVLGTYHVKALLPAGEGRRWVTAGTLRVTDKKRLRARNAEADFFNVDYGDLRGPYDGQQFRDALSPCAGVATLRVTEASGRVETVRGTLERVLSMPLHPADRVELSCDGRRVTVPEAETRLPLRRTALLSQEACDARPCLSSVTLESPGA